MKFNIKPKNKKKQLTLLIKKAYHRIKSARLLYQKGFYNDAVSRAYYGFLDAAQAALIAKGLSAKTHAGVITLFSPHFIKTNKIPAKYIRFFKKAKEAREEADYEPFKQFTKEETERIINTAQEFIKVIEKKFKK